MSTPICEADNHCLRCERCEEAKLTNAINFCVKVLQEDNLTLNRFTYVEQMMDVIKNRLQLKKILKAQSQNQTDDCEADNDGC
jgi:ferredoxin